MARRFMIIALMAAAFIGCQTKRDVTIEAPAPSPAPSEAVRPVDGSQALPHQIIYKTSVDCDNLVPVTLSADGRNVVSYPAPSDLTADSEPVRLVDGWLLDRRGVGKNTAFTRWTYAEYRALPQAPTPAEIMEAIVPGARVTEIRRLPSTVASPMTPEEIDRWIEAGD